MSIELRKITEDDLEQLMLWRMEDDITKYMFTDPKLTLEGQKKWLKSINENVNRIDWSIFLNNKIVGYIAIGDIDRENNSCSGGIFIGDGNAKNIRFFATLHYNYFEYIFEELHLHRFNIEIFEENPVNRLTRIYGAKFDGKFVDQIRKNGKYYSINHYSILENDWYELKKKINYEKIYIEKFKKINN